MTDLRFLPQGPLPATDSVPEDRRLPVDLFELLTNNVGGWTPTRITETSTAGLLLNPSRDAADTALREAMDQANASEATLMVTFIGHGAAYQEDPATPVRHLLQLWDSAATPVDEGPESRGWDIYSTIDDRRKHCPRISGLILLIDACYGSYGVHRVARWKTTEARLRSVWLASSRDTPAYDGCMSKRLLRIMRNGLPESEHHERTLVRRIRARDVAPLIEESCRGQRPVLDGWQDWDEGMYLAENVAADDRFTELGITGPTAEFLLRSSSHFGPDVRSEVLTALRRHRLVQVLGAAGSGKTTLTASLRYAHGAHLDCVDAVGFLSLTPSVEGLVEVLAGQLETIPQFRVATRRFRLRDGKEWNSLGAADRLLLGPCREFTGPLHIVIDGFDELNSADGERFRSVASHIASDPSLAHVHLAVMSRLDIGLGLNQATVSIQPAARDAALDFLATRGVQERSREVIADVANGNWFLLNSLADLPQDELVIALDNADAVWSRILGPLFDQENTSVVLPVLTVLTCAPGGPVLPISLLVKAVSGLGGSVDRLTLLEILASHNFRVLVSRTNPGTDGEQIGFVHSSVADALRTRVEVVAGHSALTDALADVDPHKLTHSDPILAYARAHAASHFWDAGKREGISDLLGRFSNLTPRDNVERFESWLARVEISLGHDHADTINCQVHLSHWIGESGNAVEARDRLTSILHESARLLGETHIVTLRARHHLARWVGEAGDLREATRAFELLLPDLDRELGSDHRGTLSARNNLAVFAGRLGETTEQQLRALLDDQKRILGHQDPATLLTRLNIAAHVANRGEHEHAIELAQAVLSDQVQLLGPDDPLTLGCRAKIAHWTQAAGRPSHAIRLARKIQIDSDAALGKDHPVSLHTQVVIARSLARLQRFDEALVILQQVADQTDRTLGPMHPDTLNANHDIAVVIGDAGNPGKAVEMLEAVLPALQDQLGEHHPDVRMTIENIRHFEGQRRP